MPTYQLKCESCGNVFKDFHKMSEEHPPCPECNGPVEVYMTEPPGFQFKGSGWASKDIKEENRLLNSL